MKDKDKKLTSSERMAAKTEGFFAKNYRLIAIIVAVIIVVCIGIGIGSLVSSNSKEEIANAVDFLEEDYNDLLLMDDTSEEYVTACNEFVVEGERILSQVRSGDYASLKTRYLLGQYHFLNEEWAEALECFDTVANEGDGTYFGSLALANAAASAENAGDQDAALAYYNRIWDEYSTDAPESPKALFNAARIYESQGDNELAVATYSQLADEFVGSEYAQLAEARLIVLE